MFSKQYKDETREESSFSLCTRALTSKSISKRVQTLKYEPFEPMIYDLKPVQFKV